MSVDKTQSFTSKLSNSKVVVDILCWLFINFISSRIFIMFCPLVSDIILWSLAKIFCHNLFDWDEALEQFLDDVPKITLTFLYFCKVDLFLAARLFSMLWIRTLHSFLIKIAIRVTNTNTIRQSKYKFAWPRIVI